MNKQFLTVDDIVAHLKNKAKEKRLLVAIAGPPGVGKSTVADTLRKSLNQNSSGFSAVLPMDGYHYDDIYLEKMGWRARKGAPHTFDVGGLAHMLQRLSKNTENQIAIPLFDRSIEIARAAADVIPSSVQIILVEGNYLLLNNGEWAGLHQYFDVTIALKASLETIKQRLQARWKHFDYSPAEISRKLASNDLLNAELVQNSSIKAEIEFFTDTNNHQASTGS